MNARIEAIGDQVQKSDLLITYLPVSSLKEFPNNPRTHTKAQVRKIAESIRTFGFTNPVLVDDQNTIIAGHGRVRAAKIIGLEQVPTIRLSSLTRSQVRAYVIADNRLALDAGWNQEILKIELQNLILDNEFDISLTGFEVCEVDLILKGESAQEDACDELPDNQPIVTQPGDLWHMGNHRVVCGDLRDESTLANLMSSRKADVVFTDPPFNVAIEGNVSGKGRVKHGNFAMACGEMSQAEFTDFLKTCLGVLASHSADGAIHFVCMDFRHMGELLAAGEQVYESLLNLCVWVKNNGGQGSFYRSRHELVFVFRHGKARHRNNVQLGKFGRYRTNVWEYPAIRVLSQQQDGEGNLLALHPTVKPVALVADAILDCSARGDLVLDGFLGSGSTLMAAERVARVCYGIELNPRYVDVAVRRWQKYTGERAVHAISGKCFDELAAEVGSE